MDSAVPDTISVAVRVRPLIKSETARGCADILQITEANNQIYIKTCDKAFTFNHAFAHSTDHAHFYKTCIQEKIGNLFKGYNTTILAYGQTGSGKTYTMGTMYSGNEIDMGVIPRAVNDIYKFINDNFSYDFVLKVSFMELYKEVLYDLLSDKDRSGSTLEIREDIKGIIIPNLTEIPATSANEVLALLSKGSSGRATGKTNMNAQSSRSHAIFIISIAMTDKKNPAICKTSKFHLVDLAGSERASKTGATGETFEEGVNINKGLLALGNVISALGDEKQQLGFISFRNSSLTRLLKDSLGGNSITLMIACVSPADYNMDETLSTLRYADRARKIKNKPVVNQDPHVAQVNKMQKTIDLLRLELAGQGGSACSQYDLDMLKAEIVQLHNKVAQSSFQLSSVISRYTAVQEQLLLVQTTNECLRDKLLELKDEYNITLSTLDGHIDAGNVAGIKSEIGKLKSLQDHIGAIDAEQRKSESEMRTYEANISVQCNRSSQVESSQAELERQESHAANQIKMHEELEGVIKSLALKEQLARQIAQDTGPMIDAQTITDNELKINALELERDELMQQLQSVQNVTVTGKLSEQRRKRVQDLEQKICDLKKRLQEQSRIIALTKKDELRIAQLNNEIKAMKQTKIQLIRNMRSEADSYRRAKLLREQELSKLRDQDRKRLNQIDRMKSLHNRQTNVLKRQMEEAAAVNKRLKASLALRKNVQEQKSHTGKIERLSQYIKNEVDVLIHITQARATLDGLLDSRATLQTQLDQLEQSTDEIRTKQLQEDIQLRSLQIGEIQQKLLDNDDSKNKINWDYIQTMAEAKHAIKLLFESIKEASKDIFQKVHNDDNNHTAELEQKIFEYEDRISIMDQELQLLKTQKVIIVKKEPKTPLNETVTIHIHPPEDNIGDENINPKNPKAKVKKTYVTMSPSELDDSNVHVVTDDESNDPDWRKTPLSKRLGTFRDRLAAPVLGPSKRNSQGGCSCRGSCTHRCGCKKTQTYCNSSCKCKESCSNRSIENEKNPPCAIPEGDDDDDDDDFVMKKPKSQFLRPKNPIGIDCSDLNGT